MDSDELSRLHRYKVEAAQRRFLLSHSLVRAVLSRHIPSVAPRSWGFVTSRHGRPELDAHSQERAVAYLGSLGMAGTLRFNLSHTDGLFAVLVAPNIDCGVDVESSHRKTDIERVARRSFTPAELASFELLSSLDKRSRFFELWTLKEAYIKAIGTGLATPLKHFGFDLGDPIPTIVFGSELEDQPSRWVLGLHRPTPTTQLAWALQTSPRDMDPTPLLRWFQHTN